MPESSPQRERRYITTPIYYVNDRPHIGHVYTTTLCDVYARFMRFAGHDVFFLTGTDEHGLKVEKSAKAHNISPQALADQNAAEFQRVLSTFALTNDDFIRTTYPYHEAQVQAFVGRLLASGDVYLGQFEGWYDEGQEEYYTETKAKELNYASPVSKKPLTRAVEKNYYFRLSKYQKPLEDLFAKNPGFVRPDARRNEVLGRLREGLQDVPISRTNFSWGIPMPPQDAAGKPTEPGHVIYVWIDALFNYISGLGLGEPATSDLHRQRARYWPATYHVIGKEILWFHSVIWPAILMALDIPVPRCIYAHSFWISEGQKMSKSLGNFIDLETIQRYLGTYGLDAWRYYLATQGPLGAQDANFAAGHFHEVYTSHLVNVVGNCPSRVTAMIGKYFDGVVPDAKESGNAETPKRRNETDPSPQASSLKPQAAAAVAAAIAAMERFDQQSAIEAGLDLLRKVDAFIHATEPFKLAKDPTRTADLSAILYDSLEAIRIASLLLWPVLPQKMEELWRAIGLEHPLPQEGEGRGVGGARGGSAPATTKTLADLSQWGGLEPGTRVSKVALFPRVEQALPGAGAPAPGGTPAAPAATPGVEPKPASKPPAPAARR